VSGATGPAGGTVNEAHSRFLIVALVLAALALTAAVAWPFHRALLLGAIGAAALRAPMERLARRTGGRRPIAATLLAAAVVALVLLPLAALGAVLAQEILAGIAWVRETIESSGVGALRARLPGPLDRVVGELVAALPRHAEDLQAFALAQGTRAAASVGSAVVATGSWVLEAALMLVALWFFLVDGARLVDWIDARLPLRPGQFRALLEDFRRTSVSALVSTVGTAALQSVLAAVGYLLARAPNVLFLAFATFVVALIPALGATVMVVLVALLLLATGHVGAGVFVLGWAAVVGLADNLVRPFFLRGGMALHGGAVFFALLGGLAAFGALGVLLGPLVLTFLVTTSRMYRSEFGAPGP
jgi:predicted PurR-regulated permease PerM